MAGIIDTPKWQPRGTQTPVSRFQDVPRCRMLVSRRFVKSRQFGIVLIRTCRLSH